MHDYEFWIPGSLAYYKRKVGWCQEQEIAAGELADAIALDQRWARHDENNLDQLEMYAFDDEERNDPERYGLDPHA
jgi:hypothetical protein